MLVVLFSYGLMVFMFPWEDDHTLMFKLANIEGKAGYFGAGPFGEGAYKYIVTPYILVYKIFGPWAPAYYGFALLFYFLATLFLQTYDNRFLKHLMLLALPRGRRSAIF